jgi:predicted NBD/HSP70 family sugar kinase
VPHTLTRHFNEQAVLETLYHHGPLTRVELATRLTLSQPTVNSLVGSLEQGSLVRRAGKREGRPGRAPTLFELNGSAGHLVAVDLGGMRLTAALTDLFGVEVTRTTQPTDTSSADAVLDQITAVSRRLAERAGVAWSAVQVVSVGFPGTVDRRTGQVGLGSKLPPFSTRDVPSELARRLGVPVAVDNDVNMAAIGEGWRGVAHGIDDFAFVSIGTGTGMGLVLDGDVRQGRTGAAGEIAWLPLAADPFDAGVRSTGGFEEAASARGLLARYRAVSGAGSADTAVTVLELAAAGDTGALEAVDGEARALATALAAVTVVVEPELLVLGGPIGCDPLLADMVGGYLLQLVPRPPRLERSALGADAGMLGAIASGLHRARTRLLRSHHLARRGA